MTSNKDVASMLLRLLAPMGPVRSRPMFGGYGIYFEDVMFALVYWGEVYFRADASIAPTFADAGANQFTYQGRSGPVNMPYWSAPPGSLEGSASVIPWATLALEAARAASAVKRGKARRRGRGRSDPRP